MPGRSWLAAPFRLVGHLGVATEFAAVLRLLVDAEMAGRQRLDGGATSLRDVDESVRSEYSQGLQVLLTGFVDYLCLATTSAGALSSLVARVVCYACDTEGSTVGRDAEERARRRGRLIK